MKRILAIVLLSVWCLPGVIQAQISHKTERKTVFKYLPVNHVLGAYSFEIERMINAKNAITVGFGIPTNQSIIGKYGIEPSSDLEEVKVGTMHIRAAFRHYAGKKKLPRGFYIEPYMKYQKINANIKAEFTAGENELDMTYSGDITTPNLSSVNLGFQMGVQFLIAKRVSLDFYFLGIEAGMLSGNVNAKVDPNDNIPDMTAELQDVIDELPGFMSDKIEVTSSDDAVNVNASSVPFPWLRSGISIGFAF